MKLYRFIKTPVPSQDCPLAGLSPHRIVPVINSINLKYIILRTPWAEESAEYAVAVDDFVTLFYSPIGSPVPAPTDMPLAEYVRECWENENGDPFYFMDWVKMASR